MRKMLLSAVLAAGTVMLLSGTPSFAIVPLEMHVTVPFEFHVEGTVLPAGRYVITNPAPGNTNLVEIRSEDGKSAALVLTESVYPGRKSPHKPDLVFRNVDGMAYLTQIWADPGTAGNGIPLPANQSSTSQAATRKHHTRNMQEPSASSQ